MTKSKIAAVVVAVSVVSGLAIYLARRPNRSSPGTSNGTAQGQGAAQAPPFTTRSDSTGNVPVPDKGAQAAANVAVPTNVAPANPQNSASWRAFDINVEGAQFKPNTIAVYVGDVVHVTFHAVDQSYDFTQPDYGFKVSLPKGQATLVELEATAPGKFSFYCASCGGPQKGPVGYLVVEPKQ